MSTQTLPIGHKTVKHLNKKNASAQLKKRQEIVNDALWLGENFSHYSMGVIFRAVGEEFGFKKSSSQTTIYGYLIRALSSPKYLKLTPDEHNIMCDRIWALWPKLGV